MLPSNKYLFCEKDTITAKSVNCVTTVVPNKSDSDVIVCLQLFSKCYFCLVIPAFFFRKKGILISYQSRSVVRLSVRPCVCVDVRPCGCASVTFLVNVSTPKLLDVATSNFVAE